MRESWGRPSRVIIATVWSLCGALSGCGRNDEGGATRPGHEGEAKGNGASTGSTPHAEPEGPGGKRCIVHLHGKSGAGGSASVAGGVTHLRPSGNAPGWGGLQWMYFPESGYREVRGIVAKAISDAGCGKVLVHGFSNGASAAAKLYCRAETFGGTAVGYIVDDPVTDHAVEGCKPPPAVKFRLYWTGGLGSAHDGWDCASGDWTCEGGTSIGIAKYARALGVEATPSIHTTHTEYSSPPEYSRLW